MSSNDKNGTGTNSQNNSYKQEVSITPKDRVDSGFYSDETDSHALGSLGIALTKSPKQMTYDSSKGDIDPLGLKEQKIATRVEQVTNYLKRSKAT